MLRIHLGAADLARVRMAARPAPLQELHAALLMLGQFQQDTLLFGQWRRRTAAALPTAAVPLLDLAPAGTAPAFLDSLALSLGEAAEQLRSTDPESLASQLEHAYAAHPAAPPVWVRGLHRDEPQSWKLLARAQRAAFDAVLGPVWPLVQDLHRQEFARHALLTAEHGVGAALAGLLPGARVNGDVWELPSPLNADIRPAGRGLVLVPTFHRRGGVLLADRPGEPLGLSYPAGPGLPPAPVADQEQALSEVLGRTRHELLRLLVAEPARAHSTRSLARLLGVREATVSAHAASLRGAGLLTTVREGRAVRHDHTALAGLLLGSPRADG